MSADAARPEPRAPRPDYTLPKLLDLQVRRVPFAATERRHFASALARYNEAMEFTVTADRPFPIRALSPVLYVGDTPITYSEAVEPHVLRFLAFEFDRLQPGARITLGWPEQAEKDRQETEFRYEPPEQ